MKKNLEEILQKIEEEANDEIKLLSDLGPEFFPMQDLIQMKYKLEKKQLEYKSQYTRILALGFTTPLLLLSGIFCLHFDLKILAILLLVLAPFTLGAVIYYSFLLKNNFGSKNDFENRIEIIDSEIIIRNCTRRKQV